ncbi:MAG: hypothetical protein ACPGU7_03960 [Gammaproteobacteria bacterium]
MSDSDPRPQNPSFQVKTAKEAFVEHTDFERARNVGNNPDFDAQLFDEARDLVLSRLEDQ